MILNTLVLETLAELAVSRLIAAKGCYLILMKPSLIVSG